MPNEEKPAQIVLMRSKLPEPAAAGEGLFACNLHCPAYPLWLMPDSFPFALIRGKMSSIVAIAAPKLLNRRHLKSDSKVTATH